MDNEFGTKNQKKRESLLKVVVDSFLTLVVIVLIVGFMLAFVKHIYWLATIIGGAFLLVIDIVMFTREFEKERKRNFLLPIIMCIIGIVMVLCGTMLRKDPAWVKAFVMKYALLFAMLLFLSIGVGVVLFAITEPRRKRRYCTVRVFGECCFNPPEGEKRELYVDTETMDEIYEPIRAGKFRKFTYGLGVCFIIFPILGLIVMYLGR